MVTPIMVVMTENKRDISPTAHEWLQAVCEATGTEFDDLRPLIPGLLDLTRAVAHGPSRPSAPLTCYLIGLAVGRADGDTELAGRHIASLAELVDNFTAEAK